MKREHCPVSRDEKQRMIATAAYYRFVKKGGSKSDPLADWLAAEVEIEKALQTDCRRKFPFFIKSRSQRTGLLDVVTGWMYRVTTRSRSKQRHRIG
jgi:hypothetical protein